jgi:ABC-type transport system involved in multi-copper enzyme maturation permease subunit
MLMTGCVPKAQGRMGREAESCNQHIGSPIQDRRFHYEKLPGILEGMSWFAILLGWLLGASLVDAEWHARTMATLLTWEPRRVRVLVVKLVAAGALAFTLAVGLQLLLGVALLPAGLLRGTTEGIDWSWMRSLFGVGVRVAAVSIVGALIGCSIAAISRTTAAALGIAFGYFAIVENAIRGLRPHWTPWLLGDNLAVVITNQPQNFPLVGRSTVGAAILVGCYTLTLVVAAVATFRRRDIT